MLRQQRGLTDVRACPLEALLSADDIFLGHSDGNDLGCAALLYRLESVAGILIESGQSPQRERFSIAHELGHYYNPSHAKHGDFQCGDPDMRTRSTDAKQREWEANDFASELLMPFTLFSKDVRAQSLTIELAVRLAGADLYNVSIFAAAWRIIQTTRESAALIVTTDGVIDWVTRSKNFGGWITDRGEPPRPDTLAHSVLRGEGAHARGAEVPAAAWFDSPDQASGSVLESTYAIERTNQVVSLLWRPEADYGDHDLDERS
jgi:IrrE N-terminal-like domain